MEKSMKDMPTSNVQSVIQIDPKLLKNGTCMIPLNLQIFLNPDSSIGVKVEEPDKKPVVEKENNANVKIKNESEKTLTWPQNLTPLVKDSIDSLSNYPSTINNASLKSLESQKKNETKRNIPNTSRKNYMKEPVRAEDNTDIENPKTCMQFCGLASKTGGCMDPDMEKVLVKTLEGKKIERINKNSDRDTKRSEKEVKLPEREVKLPEREIKYPLKEKKQIEIEPTYQIDTVQDTIEKKNNRFTQTSKVTLDPIYTINSEEITKPSSIHTLKKKDEKSAFSISIQVNENDNTALCKKTEKNNVNRLKIQIEKLKNHIQEDNCTSKKCKQKLDELIMQING